MVKSGPTFGDDREITPEFEQQVRDYYRAETTHIQVRGACYATDATGGEGVDLRSGERLETRQRAGEERPTVITGTTGDEEREGEACRVKVHKRVRGVQSER